jgi:glycosyltransferase involved in cell wall biosynthesis
MRILGIMMVRNGERTLGATLDHMALYCDAVFVLDDRSTDETRRICEAHPIVRNVFSARNDVSCQPWFHPESLCLDFLYRMADFEQPDWVVQLDDDQTLEPAVEVRTVLASVPPEAAALRLPLASTWSDPAYPDLVPVMGSGRSMNGAVWRYFPGLKAGVQPLHNFRLPSNIGDFGTVEERRELMIVHRGWDTLAKRIERVDFYTALDPEFRYNHGVPYDRGLLFGFGRTEIPRLIESYRSRLASEPITVD